MSAFALHVILEEAFGLYGGTGAFGCIARLPRTLVISCHSHHTLIASNHECVQLIETMPQQPPSFYAMSSFSATPHAIFHYNSPRQPCQLNPHPTPASHVTHT
ncbi:hypothetical protein EYC84_002387 [Monilinia fructicola]|uniref:Uncharacterized protein n=1 Tax=Monilinia fructicola TaxID=38448 RepID=A0A5M9JL84_MONFR|nr:hypothetical protein EYC84_002387 [Monilinia fructicola]